MKILLMNSSPNEYGCTYTALKECADEMERCGARTEIFWLGKKPVPGCIACGKCGELGKCVFGGITDEAMEKLRQADGMIVGSPVYYASPNGSLLAFLDRLYFSAGGLLRHKPYAAVVSARRAGTTASLEVLNKYGLINQQPLAASKYWTMVHGMTPEEVREDKEGMQVMRVLGRNMVWLAGCIEAGRTMGLTPPEPEAEAAVTNFIR